VLRVGQRERGRVVRLLSHGRCIQGGHKGRHPASAGVPKRCYQAEAFVEPIYVFLTSQPKKTGRVGGESVRERGGGGNRGVPLCGKG